MKTQVTIYGETYEVEIKAKNVRNSKVTKKATLMVTNWLEARLWDSAIENAEFISIHKEIVEVASKLHRFDELQLS